MSEVGELNQKEVVAILRTITGCCCQAQPKWQEMVAAWINTVIRLNLGRVYKDEIRLGFHVFDDSLLATFNSFRRCANPVRSFWQAHGEACRLVLDLDDAKMVMQSPASDYHTVLPQAVRLVNKSHLARALFHPVVRKGTALYLSDLYHNMASTIAVPITHRQLDERNRIVWGEIQRVNADVLLRGRRSTTAVYRGKEFTITVTSPGQDGSD